jgi:hypothetical protein
VEKEVVQHFLIFWQKREGLNTENKHYSMTAVDGGERQQRHVQNYELKNKYNLPDKCV